VVAARDHTRDHLSPKIDHPLARRVVLRATEVYTRSRIRAHAWTTNYNKNSIRDTRDSLRIASSLLHSHGRPALSAFHVTPRWPRLLFIRAAEPRILSRMRRIARIVRVIEESRVEQLTALRDRGRESGEERRGEERLRPQRFSFRARWRVQEPSFLSRVRDAAVNSAAGRPVLVARWLRERLRLPLFHGSPAKAERRRGGVQHYCKAARK
jgi:hypothetical protein